MATVPISSTRMQQHGHSRRVSPIWLQRSGSARQRTVPVNSNPRCKHRWQQTCKWDSIRYNSRCNSRCNKYNNKWRCSPHMSRHLLSNRLSTFHHRPTQYNRRPSSSSGTSNGNANEKRVVAQTATLGKECQIEVISMDLSTHPTRHSSKATSNILRIKITAGRMDMMWRTTTQVGRVTTQSSAINAWHTRAIQ